MDISEKNFEALIEAALLAGGPDALPGSDGIAEAPRAYGSDLPGGYLRRTSHDYDRTLCLLPGDVISFVVATQPKEWEKLKQQHGDEVKPRFLKRLASEISKRGTIDVLRNGVKDSGSTFRLAYFQPSSGLNEALRTLYQANIFAVVRQLHYSVKGQRDQGNSLDLAIFLNGLPLFTAELKNTLTGQNVQDAVRQYRFDRDPGEPLLAFRRCLAHFAVDPDLVMVTTQLQGTQTRFLPFNQGYNRGPGNPPSRTSFPTAYLWNTVWSRASVLDLIQHFVHEIEEEDDRGNKTGKRRLLFPRYHQLDAVRRLIADVRQQGAGQRYLIQHSAGSGKSNSIAWLAHQLSLVHDADDRRVFDSIIVITDRRVLDRQLQRTVLQFEHTPGVVENIDTTARQLKQALEDGKTIIVTTLQKFPVIAQEIGELPGQRFAVIVDEAHSSQSGETTKSLKAVLAASSLEAAEREDSATGDDLEDRIVAEMRSRGKLPNVSYFAFTATPKPKTLEIFGSKQPNGEYAPFSLYSMRQAIEEGFILDVLANYTTYQAYWSLLKRIEDDPRYDKAEAEQLLRAFVEMHEHTVGKKVAIMVRHFVEHVSQRIDGKAKAMIVTRSRLHAVRYKQAVDAYLREHGYAFKALVAFSGTVHDGGAEYTETGMNGISETQTAATFEGNAYRLLIVANKFQTGFDQPLLHTMYVDKKLGGVNAVQTLSRLNRTYAGKSETMVLDFANEAAEIQQAFEPYYETTLLASGTDPNLLYDLETSLQAFHLYSEAEVNSFAAIYFDPQATQDRLQAALQPVVARYTSELSAEAQAEFRHQLTGYTRLYAFLSQIISFTDVALEKLYHFARLLLRKLPVERDQLPSEIQQNIDMDSYRLQQTSQGKIPLQRGMGGLEPMGSKGQQGTQIEEIEALSAIIRSLNKRFGTDFSDDDKVFIRHLEEKLSEDVGLEKSVQVNSRENARLTFNHVVTDHLQEMVETNFKFYKHVSDDAQFADLFLQWLFDRYLATAKRAA